MAFVSAFKHDVFVSYARADDVVDTSGKGWVSQFVKILDVALRQRLGGSTELRVFFDSRNLNSNHQLNELIDAAKRSAVFLAIASRSYARRDWTRRELDSFIGAAGDTYRLFAAECLPLDGGEVYPDPLQGHKRMTFWRIDEPNSDTPMPLSPSADSTTFHQRIHDLAEQIRKQLLKLNANTSRQVASVGGPKQILDPEPIRVRSPAYRRVLLAQVTDDLDDEREQVRRHLEQFDVAMVPAGMYPQGGDAFKAAFQGDLERADLFVQLLGAYTGRTPPDLAEGYTWFQHAAVRAQGIEILQWRRPDLDPDSVSNPRQRELLKGQDVVAIGFESFKAEVVRRATEPAAPRTRETRSSLVFIDADKDDVGIAKTLQSEFSKYKFATVVSSLAGAAEEIRADLEANLIDCNALVLVYGETSPIWVRGQLRLFNKLQGRRPQPPRILAIYTGPPAKKPEVGFHLPDVREIDCRSAVTMEPVRAIIEELSR